MSIQQEKKLPKGRIASLDQFRGFAIFGMILVNYLGYFNSVSGTMKHPNFGMTFANTIAPFFLFAVGMGLRISLANRIQKSGLLNGYWSAIKRYLILIIIGIIIYGPDPKLGIWDALVDIGFAGLITLPFILSGRWIRISMALFYLLLYQCLFAFTGYGEWTMNNSIDGGPLGVLSWSSILIFGSVLMDDLSSLSSGAFIRRSLASAMILITIGFGLSLLDPAPLWEFSQRSMTIAYPLFSTGLSYAVFILFYWLADLRKIEIPHLRVLGINSLALYLVQNIIIEFYGKRLNRDAPLWQALCGVVIVYLICFAVARYLDRNKMIVKI